MRLPHVILFFIICHVVSSTYRVELYKYFSLDSIKLATFKSNVKYYKDSLEAYLKGTSQVKFDKNIEFSGAIALGSPMQRFTVQLDSGYSGLWVFSHDCQLPYYICLTKKHKYNSKDSKTYRPDSVNGSTTATIKGHGMRIVGSYGLDTLSIMGGSAIHDQQMLMVSEFCTEDKLCELEYHSVTDGQFGLGLPSADLAVASPVLTILDRGLIADPIFCLHMDRIKGEGELLIGGRNKLLYNETTLEFFSLNANTKWWSADFQSIYLNREELCIGGPCNVILDTGTALMAMPSISLSSIYKALGMDTISMEEVVEVSCNSIISLPHLTFYIKNIYGDIKAFTMSGPEYVIRLNGRCVLGFMENRNSSTWVLGNLFLQNFYTIFNYGSRQIGLANIAVHR